MTPAELEERTYRFARDCRLFVKTLDDRMMHRSDIDQLVRASGSVAANYIEANDALGKKDFVMRLRICRKEAKETHCWLRLVQECVDGVPGEETMRLRREAVELQKIFGAAIRTLEHRINQPI